MSQTIKRRELLRLSGIAGAGALFGAIGRAQEVCQPTAPQTEGPFYPVNVQRDRDYDLTQVEGRSGVATGEVVIVQGRILDVNCRPVAGALVEIWQACHTGKYNHPSDPNTAALDPDFHYWGRVISNAKGEYRFKTIIPGAYPASANWMRPPHIHFKVTAPGRRSFTTQMYFAGNALNDKDHILLNLTAAQRRNVIVSFDAAAGSNLLPTGVFDITLNISGSDALTPELD